MTAETKYSNLYTVWFKSLLQQEAETAVIPKNRLAEPITGALETWATFREHVTSCLEILRQKTGNQNLKKLIDTRERSLG